MKGNRQDHGGRRSRFFQDLPITRKLTIIIMAVSATALLVASSAFIVNEVLEFRRSTVGEMSTLASVVGLSTYPALVFLDRQAAEENMSTLHSEPTVIAAYIYNSEGELFARYQRDGLGPPLPQPCSEQHPFVGDRLSPEAVEVPGHQFCRNHLDLFKPIVSDNDLLGTVYIQGDLSEVTHTLWRYLGIVAAVMAGAFAIAFVLSSYLQRVISMPIVALARTMRAVSLGSDYSVRAEAAGNDEVGNLMAGFNEMLEQIHARDAQLEQYRDHLEEQVSSRTLELARARDEALAASRAKSAFVANMSHEIRTPLHAILGHTQLLQRADNLLPDQGEALATIEASGDHLLTLINSILDLSKIEVGAMEVHESELDLFELLRNLSSMFRARCQEKGVTWSLRGIADECVVVRADAHKLRRILINLVGNAVKFTDEGEVILAVDRHGDRFRFDVIDTGPGISAADQEHLADPFHQGEAGERKGGTGLGLAIAKRLIELMGGAIELESEPGKGSRFFFALSLPVIACGSRTPAAMVLAPSPHLPEGVTLSALVADDLKENIEVLARILLDLGAEVQEAHNGQEAIESLHRHVPDIVFMDIRMPVMDGVQALQAIREQHGPGAVKCVAVTASSMSIEKDRLLREGFVDFIAKPFRFEEVYECLSRHLGITFEYSALEPAPAKKPTASAPDCSRIAVPPELASAIATAAKLYQVSDLEDYLAELQTLGSEQHHLAEYLRELLNCFDLPGIEEVMRNVTLDTSLDTPADTI